MINYAWDCRTVDVYPTEGSNTDVVYNVHYRVTGEDDETAVRADSIGTQMLDTSDITGFIPFSDLTNEQVVDWTKASLGDETIAVIEKNIADQISEKENPTSVTMHIED
jgi:alkyl hydroperoxide reductase subunit AhpF